MGQCIADRIPVTVFLDIDSRDFQFTLHCGRHLRIGQILLVGSPFSAYQLQSTEAQHDRFLKSCHIHTHETNRLEIIDCPHTTLVLFYRNLKLIPGNGFCRTIRQSY